MYGDSPENDLEQSAQKFYQPSSTPLSLGGLLCSEIRVFWTTGDLFQFFLFQISHKDVTTLVYMIPL